MDVVLEAGDVLYVPRGCLHATSTLDSDSTSMHLTVGVEAMWGTSSLLGRHRKTQIARLNTLMTRTH